MNTVFVYMTLVGRMWMPQYVVEYPTQEACMAAVSKAALDAGRFASTKAICVPKVSLK